MPINVLAYFQKSLIIITEVRECTTYKNPFLEKERFLWMSRDQI